MEHKSNNLILSRISFSRVCVRPNVSSVSKFVCCPSVCSLIREFTRPSVWSFLCLSTRLFVPSFVRSSVISCTTSFGRLLVHSLFQYYNMFIPDHMRTQRVTTFTKTVSIQAEQLYKAAIHKRINTPYPSYGVNS